MIAFILDKAEEVNRDDPDSDYTKRMLLNPDRFREKDGIKYLGFVFHASTPLINRKSMGITFATQKNSLTSAIDQLIDYEHLAEDFNRAESTNVIGHICELWFSEEPTQWLIPNIIPAQPILTRGIMALYTRKREVNELFQSVLAGESWYFSLEAGNQSSADIWLVGTGSLPHKIIPYNDAEEELKRAAEQNSPEIIYQGQQVAYIGGALTKRPAGMEQNVDGNQLKFLCSIDVTEPIGDKSIAMWKSMDDVPANMKTMDGASLTLAQVNHIARMADAIKKESPNVNEWAVAKSQFKKLYKKEGDAWIEKKQASFTIIVSEIQIANVTDFITTHQGDVEQLEIELLDDKNLMAFSEMLLTMRGENKMPFKTFETEEDWNKEVTTIKDTAVNEAVTGGKFLSAETVSTTMIPKADHDTLVAKAVTEKVREYKIASLGLDDETTGELQVLARSDKFPYDETGEKKFDDACKKWKEKFTASAPSPAGDKGKAGMEGEDDKGKNFDPGSGDRGGTSEIKAPGSVWA